MEVPHCVKEEWVIELKIVRWAGRIKALLAGFDQGKWQSRLVLLFCDTNDVFWL